MTDSNAPQTAEERQRQDEYDRRRDEAVKCKLVQDLLVDVAGGRWQSKESRFAFLVGKSRPFRVIRGRGPGKDNKSNFVEIQDMTESYLLTFLGGEKPSAWARLKKNGQLVFTGGGAAEKDVMRAGSGSMRLKDLTGERKRDHRVGKRSGHNKPLN